jgi:hypothetical protein
VQSKIAAGVGFKSSIFNIYHPPWINRDSFLASNPPQNKFSIAL